VGAPALAGAIRPSIIKRRVTERIRTARLMGTSIDTGDACGVVFHEARRSPTEDVPDDIARPSKWRPPEAERLHRPTVPEKRFTRGTAGGIMCVGPGIFLRPS
jgi:hypothetical protein